MAKSSHVRLLGLGADQWNVWRRDHPAVVPDLSGADLRRATLRGYNLSMARLDSSDLRDTHIRRADLSGARLNGARMHRAFLSGTRIGPAAFKGTVLYETLFADVDLSEALHLRTCLHKGPSVLDHRTLARSKDLPIEFLRGCGLPDSAISELIGDRERADYPSVFISYSTEDERFVQTLFDHLQERGVRCWFAPHSVRIGDKVGDAIDHGIRGSEKVLLVLSESALASRWVETEVAATLEEEARRDASLLFPIRLDDSVMTTEASWASNIRRLRNIGDFTAWRDKRSYAIALERLLDDLLREGPA